MRVLITGASGGLGAAVVEQFLAEGCQVAGVARSWTECDERFQRISADLTSEEGSARAVAEAGPVDALVHVLGGFAGGEPVATASQLEWDRMLKLNLGAAFHSFRAVLPGMLERRRGRIIAVGSRAGVEPVAGLSAYGVSKAGLVHLVRTLALELKDTGVTANIVLPSIIDTAANRAAMPGADASKWVQPESIAKVVSWLASDGARDINGAVIPVYGEA
ncbi:MAG: SDR family oxidoreductase [Acidobacteria bacterium]|nr:SDR family oxidoreductase [Acidobacteriota bacterium]